MKGRNVSHTPLNTKAQTRANLCFLSHTRFSARIPPNYDSPFPGLIKDVLTLSADETEGSILLPSFPSIFIAAASAIAVLVEQRQLAKHVLGSDASHFRLGHAFPPRVVGLGGEGRSFICALAPPKEAGKQPLLGLDS